MTLRVLHVIPSLGPLRGGTSLAVLTMAQGLAQTGLDIYIATTDDNGPDAHLNVPLGQPIVQSGVTHWYFRRQTRFYAFSCPLTSWLAHHIHYYDLVHIHALFSYASLPTAFCAATRSIPYIVQPHGMLNHWGMHNRRPWLKKFSFQLIERRILARASSILFTCEHEHLQAEGLGLHTPSSIIPVPLDLTPFACLPAPDNFRTQYPKLAQKRLILFLSRLDPKKGLDLLLPAFAQVSRTIPDIALVLAGSGDPSYEAWLRAEVQTLGIENAVLFTGFLHGEQKLAALVDCDLFVLPSYSENFGLAVAEAMASGLPIIISDQVGIAHEVAQAQAGLIVPCDTDKLAAALVQLLKDSDQRERLVSNAHQLVQQRFALESVTEALIQVYSTVVTTKPGVIIS